MNAAYASAGVCAEPNPKNEQHDPRLFMVEEPEDLLRSDSAILRSLDEIDGSASMNHTVPYLGDCAYTFFQGGFI